MAKFTITINSILGGIAPNLFKGGPDQFSQSIGIDPDKSIDGNSTKTSGVLVPSAYQDFTGTGLTGYARWFITNPKNEILYVYANDGKLMSYSSTFGSETNIGTPTNGAGQGAAYYNNYIYLATTTDIARYGPLSETPSLTNTVWTGTTLGSQTALGNPTYPTNRNAAISNHPMHVHVDNKLYVGDFSTAAEANRGRGLIHWIRTTRGTDEGDTNDGTTRSAFVLPFGYAPTDIESWGTDLVVAAIYIGGANTAGTAIAANNTLMSGKAALFFWDAINAPSLPYRMVPLVDPTVTALLNHNGNLFVWSGNMNSGVRVSVYEGGYRLKQLAFFEEGFSPPAGCVDGLGNRVVWGAYTTYPENSASVYALGYKDASLPLVLHNIATAGGTFGTTNTMVTALKYVQHASYAEPRFIMGWQDDSTPTTDFGIDRLGVTARIAVWRSLTYGIGRPFRINKISIPLGGAITANTTITPSIRVDGDSSSTTLTAISSANFTASERRVVLYPTVYGLNDFNLQFRWSGTTVIAITLPIVIEGETLEDATG